MSRALRSRPLNSSVVCSPDEENDPPKQRTIKPKPPLPDRPKPTLLQGNSTPKPPSTPLVQADVRSPLSPLYDNVANIRNRLEQLLGSRQTPNQTSCEPTPTKQKPVSKIMQAKQKVLLAKHQQAKSSTDQVSGVGGGVCLWPGMASMRLTSSEFTFLAATSLALFCATLLFFCWMHGDLINDLNSYTAVMYNTSSQLPLLLHHDGEAFAASLLHWHSQFYSLMEDIDARFSMVQGESCLYNHAGVVLYITGIGSLLYLLYDNIVSKSKLTPHRIKVWVTLLVLLATWTALSVRLLLAAGALESSVEAVVHALNELLAQLVLKSDADLTSYNNILLYWRTRCLPPTARGTLHLLGVVPVRDLAYYLQYYSLPILTALVTPVLRLVLALVQIYSQPL